MPQNKKAYQPMAKIKNMSDLHRLSKFMDLHGEDEGLKKFQEEQESMVDQEGHAEEKTDVGEPAKGPQLDPKKVKSFVTSFSK